MPVRTPDRIVKVSCPACSWHLIINRGGMGDCLAGSNAVKFASNRIGETCPRCGCKELTETPASLWARINPVEHLRRLYYVFRQNSCSNEQDDSPA